MEIYRHLNLNPAADGVMQLQCASHSSLQLIICNGPKAKPLQKFTWNLEIIFQTFILGGSMSGAVHVFNFLCVFWHDRQVCPNIDLVWLGRKRKNLVTCHGLEHSLRDSCPLANKETRNETDARNI